MAAKLSKTLINQMQAVGKSLAFEAGKIICERLGKPDLIETKAPSDYVTDVDRTIEQVILEGLHRHFPDHNVVSEEMAASEMTRTINWIIDPLDGTRNFIHGIPHVAVSIGVYFDGSALFGLVLDPIRNELFSASKGGGAFLNGAPIRVRRQFRVEEALVATGFPFRAKHLLDPYQATLKSILEHVGDLRRTGSAALDLAYVAAGRLDGFWELALGSWDLAAGSLMVREAGGIVSDFWGRDDYMENGHVVAGAPPIYPLLLESVKTLLAPFLEAGSNPKPSR
jgi:myo-inositol-1(or 4)-monophosphatase